MKHTFTIYTFIFASVILATAACGAEPGTPAVQHMSARHLNEKALSGVYVFSGQVLLNPITDMSNPQNPVRSLVNCFSIGEILFDGEGSMARKVEIFCPTTPEILAAGLGAPPPVGYPTEQQLNILGSTLTSEGEYKIFADGWGEWSEEGEFRLGPVPHNPAAGHAQFAIGPLDRSGIAEEIYFLVKNQSIQAPGAPMLINGDVGATFVAKRRR